MKKEQKKDPDKKKKQILREDLGKTTPPSDRAYITGGKSPSTRPEQGPAVPPQENTEGIP